ncbi:hypothetical protein pEaSNUABM37_00308 [Erwinia phage pEa_SNUABM_37]|nr:hypothetical protein pEaSNUABM37_00308 [Erwinia phage pEa_SNUABM_37]QXO10776.1 hypothetical protein pEaSNUABM48_00308 [Erwinia phage pEa_SNUABM_48]
MSTTPLYPLAKPEAQPAPESNWEYLETGVRHYTIELLQQYRNQCMLAVNPNIIHFHPNPNILNPCIETLLTCIQNTEQQLAAIHPKHLGRKGNAMAASDIAQFLAIHEEYVLIQSNMLQLWDNYFVPLFNSNEQAHAAALKAQNDQKGN